MKFRIADTFTDSLNKLTGDEQKAVKTTAFDLQLNPANPGMQFHRLDRAKDPNFWSVRVSRDIRLIVHKTDADLLLCYVDHHDEAYAWAERRRIEKHPRTGAAQLVEVRERVHEVTIAKYVEVEEPTPAKPPLFADRDDDELLQYGIPVEWLEEVRSATEDTILDLTDHLPSEAAEALLDVATGTTPQTLEAVAESVSAFDHPDAQRRFRIMTNVEELERALDYPWEKWTVFLHPAQRDLVERDFNGPARVSGSAGTGKTIVALHRAAHLARTRPDASVLLTTFSDTLADSLRLKLSRLAGNEPSVLDRVVVRPMDAIGQELYAEQVGELELATDGDIRAEIQKAAKGVDDKRFTHQFLWNEWRDVVDAWQLSSWEEYRDVKRLGRKTRLGEDQRRALWEVFERVRASLRKRKLVTLSSAFSLLAEALASSGARPFDFAVVDEAQDIGVPQLRFLATLAGERKTALFFCGDLGQRIFQTPFSWKSLGVDIRGRSRTLRINYRTSHQIRRKADNLLPQALADVDGNEESRKGTVSVFNGAEPTVSVVGSEQEEQEAVASWLNDRVAEKVLPHEVGVIVRSEREIGRARKAIEAAGLNPVELSAAVDSEQNCVAAATMHLAKGLEFRAVVVMACDDDVVPQQERVEAVTDASDLEEVYSTERHLLYVACTRARDHLLVTGIDPASEFLEDLVGKGAGQ